MGPGAARRRAGWLAVFPVAIVVLLVGPVIAGLLGSGLPAFGILPALGHAQLSLDPWRELLATPGIGTSVLLSLGTGLASTAIAFLAVVLFMAASSGTRLFRTAALLISPLLSLPHAAAAVGFAFLVAPSGWLMRLVSPWATGFTRPPDLLIVHDPMGLTLTLGLAFKEIPFLWLVALAALPRTDADRSRRLAASLGYGPVTGFLVTVMPRLYPQIRLAVYAVIAFATSNVDVAMILGPTTPPPLGPQLLRLASDPGLLTRLPASAAALTQLAVSLGAIALWRGLEVLAVRAISFVAIRGRRRNGDALAAGLGLIAMVAALAAMIGGVAALVLWSLADHWRFPDALPHRLAPGRWLMRLPDLAEPALNTVLVAGGAVALAVLLVVGTLEAETRRATLARRDDGRRRAYLFVYLPLLVPQVTFLFGLQVFFLAGGVTPDLVAVIAVHLVFVLPYVMLSLSDPWRALDPRYAQVATSLGASSARVFWQVRLPMLLRPVLVAAAVGFAVSIGLYLPTILIGAGRVETVTTQAVALSAGGDRRLLAIVALSQTLLPFLGFALAALVPALAFGGRLRQRAL
ncbi:ABC transporter permease [Hartmannibacter diazotrophicus]|uniref:ABC transporter permease n=1 Tax=Hartmannibacter diazotrophicus TaxID=1482074 RepID=UPI001FEA2761|nr:ABC transporter permease subunit [Hartmannibacter diazotrophicus]